MTKFKIGDRVRLLPGHEYSHQNDGVGTIVETVETYDGWCSDFEWRVEWDAKKTTHPKRNVYASQHLRMEEVASLLPKGDFSEDEIEQAREFIDG